MAAHGAADPDGQPGGGLGAAVRGPLASTTSVPAWASAVAMARPSPAEPPVTTATCPAWDSPGCAAAGPAVSWS